MKQSTHFEKDCPEVKLEMTAMIDVVFLLLIFFMVTMNFSSRDGLLKQRLPERGSRPGPPDPAEQRFELWIRLVEARPKQLMQLDRQRRSAAQVFQGQPYLRGDAMFRMRFVIGHQTLLEMVQRTEQGQGQPVTTVRLSANGRSVRSPAGLEQRLRRILAASPKMLVKIKPDRAATYEAMILALNTCLRAGFRREQIQFAGKTGPN